MYELRQQQRKQMREHKFFHHFILAIGIFVYSQGCSLMPYKVGYAATAAILGIIMHNSSAGKVLEKIFKIKSHKKAQGTLIILLIVIAAISYFIDFGFIFFLILDIASIIIYVAISLILSKKDRSK